MHNPVNGPTLVRLVDLSSLSIKADCASGVVGNRNITPTIEPSRTKECQGVTATIN